jgi:hypothetical protein
MSMCVDDMRDRQILIGGALRKDLRRVRGIDEHALP